MSSACELQTVDRPAAPVEDPCEELQRQVGELTRALGAATTELESLAYSVSHDLRAPLRAVNGFARILREEQGERLDDEGRELLSQIEAAGANMNGLLESLLALSKLSRAPLRLKTVDLRSVAEEILARLRDADPGRRVEVVFAGDLAAHGDPSLVRTALDHLLSNAWKFSAKRTDARIEVGRLAGLLPTFFVRDNGAGFDQAYAERLFAPFQRFHAADEFAGAGVGLAAVQRIVRRHGGRIWAEAAPGRGATFFFTLAPAGAGAGEDAAGL